MTHRKTKLRIMSVVGARPNFTKIAPLIRAFRERPNRALFEHCLVHTGQHYDPDMSGVFFSSLGIPQPDMNLEIGSGTHAEQVGRTMIEFEKAVRKWNPDWIVVVGDVNATCACSITAKKENRKLAHVEAGLRSFDPTMPEEINRIVTDRLADLLFTPDRIAGAQLLSEGTPRSRIKFVGNIMIDTLEAERKAAARLDPSEIVRGSRLPATRPAGRAREEALQHDGFAVLTLHRPSNVDDPKTLRSIVSFLVKDVAGKMPLVWALHPRTAKRLHEFGLWKQILGAKAVWIVPPLGYLQMLCLNMHAAVVLTDSGGLQEECCVLGTPCITLRENTERPITLTEHGGVSALAGRDVPKMRRLFSAMTADRQRKPFRPPLWDGHTAERIVKVFAGLARDRRRKEC